MKHRSFFGTLFALVTAPFVAKVVAPEQFSVDMDWSKIPDPFVHYLAPAIDPFPFKPFATFPADIEAMETIKTNGHDDVLLVISGGVGYLVDQHGTATRL